MLRLPDASVQASQVTKDIHSIHAIGGGGVEFLGYYNYGLGDPSDLPSNWSIYGFGTSAFKSLFQTALNAAGELGLDFDFALGANQGQGVPSEPQTPGLAKELVYGTAKIHGGDNFSGKLPAPLSDFNFLTGFMNPLEHWGSNELYAVVAAQLDYRINLGEYFYQSVLNETSLRDLSGQVKNGSITWTAPEGNSTWILFAFYERYTNQRSCIGGPGATTAISNGSWMVDHFSADGAQRTTAFWDQNIFNDPLTKTAVEKYGTYSWEDSMEMQAALWWTPGFTEKFETVHGYSIIPYLPVLFHSSNAWNGYLPPYNDTYTFGPVYPTDGGKYAQDYRKVLNQGYQEYLEHYHNWASSYNLGHSCQPAYNLPLDMSADVPKVDVPELESLGFNDDVDLYRQFTGAAHLAGLPFISTEVGAVQVGAYSLTVPQLLLLFKNGWATGINKMVVHGFPYEGNYYGTTWPGFTTFAYTYTEMWGPRQPAWSHLNDSFLYTSRNNWALQVGVPRIDLAFYYWSDPWKATDIYDGHDLGAAGYTYEYLGPENLLSTHANVSDGLLAVGGPSYKALVLYNQAYITPAASARLLEFASTGLPIFIVGNIPNTTVGTSGQSIVSGNMANVTTQYSNVKVLTAAEFSHSTLSDAGVMPRTYIRSNNAPSQLYTFWRSDEALDLEIVFLLNRGPKASFNIIFDVPSAYYPYVLDAWTGSQSPLLVYNRSSAGLEISLVLSANQTMLLAFTPGKGEIPHVSALSSNIAGLQLVDGEIRATVSDGKQAYVVMPDGARKAVAVPSLCQSTPSTLTIHAWNLTIESYQPASDLLDVAGTRKIVKVGMLETLLTWINIPGAEQISGIGTYESVFNLPAWNGSVVTSISFGPVLSTLRAWVNGQVVPAVDPAEAIADITDLVIPGLNYIKIEVSSSLFNAVKANLEELTSAGIAPNNPALYSETAWAGFGLIGPVVVKTLQQFAIQ
ncbi:hypothetical protein GQ53DRAFT_663304 [Thozetella sp. PMI_491]|nr:hypothetical protein GQ53DRAFT_663304 [Thozetella sp. PMI_491]